MPRRPPAHRAIYVGTLAHTFSWAQTRHAELADTGVGIHVAATGVVATEFHEVQGMDQSAVPRTSAEDVGTTALASRCQS